MRALLTPENAHVGSGVDLHEWYAEAWSDTGGLRVNVIASVDGGITVNGLSRGLQTPGDNEVFAVLRDLADVVLVAAGTARTEGYRRVTLPPARRKWRREHGFGDQLPIVVVSRVLDLDPGSQLFVGANHEQNPTVVVTSESSPAERRRVLSEVAEVVVVGDDEVDLVAVRDVLAHRGWIRVLCEGGPSLCAAVAHAGLVDELDLSLSPMLVGPGARRMVDGPPWPAGPLELSLHALLEEDGAVFARYRRPGAGEAGCGRRR